ncbi:VTT domain-containing protein [Plasmodiophora brassicae]
MGDRVAATTESIDPIDDLASDTDEEPAFKTEPGLIARIGISLSKRPKTIIVVVSFLITAALLINYQAVGRVVVALIAFWIDQPVPGFFVFVIIYTAAALLKLPVTEFVLAAGYVCVRRFGTYLGVAVACLEVFAACFVSSTMAYGVGRVLCLKRVQAWIRMSRKLEAVAVLLQQDGTRVSIMLRMASLLPFGTTNFVLAALDCPLRAYAIGTLGLIPYIFTYVLVGASVSSITDVLSSKSNDATLNLALIVTSIVITLVTSLYISIRTRRALGRLENQERRRSVTMRRNSQIALNIMMMQAAADAAAQAHPASKHSSAASSLQQDADASPTSHHQQ